MQEAVQVVIVKSRQQALTELATEVTGLFCLAYQVLTQLAQAFRGLRRQLRSCLGGAKSASPKL